MDAPQTSPAAGLTPKRFLTAFLLTLRSTVIIGCLSIALFAARKGISDASQLKDVAQQNKTLLIGIFVVLLIWNTWRAALSADKR